MKYDGQRMLRIWDNGIWWVSTVWEGMDMMYNGMENVRLHDERRLMEMLALVG